MKKIVEGLPEIEKERPFISINGKVYTWKQALEEVKKDENIAIIGGVKYQLTEIK